MHIFTSIREPRLSFQMEIEGQVISATPRGPNHASQASKKGWNSLQALGLLVTAWRGLRYGAVGPAAWVFCVSRIECHAYICYFDVFLVCKMLLFGGCSRCPWSGVNSQSSRSAPRWWHLKIAESAKDVAPVVLHVCLHVWASILSFHMPRHTHHELLDSIWTWVTLDVCGRSECSSSLCLLVHVVRVGLRFDPAELKWRSIIWVRSALN